MNIIVGAKINHRHWKNKWVVIVAINKKGYVVRRWMRDNWGREFQTVGERELMDKEELESHFDIEEWQQRTRKEKLKSIL